MFYNPAILLLDMYLRETLVHVEREYTQFSANV